MNRIDDFIAIFNPRWALNRAKDRMAFNEIRNYDAAGKSRRTSGWGATGTSANSETQKGLRTLRDRSRELTRNNPYGKRAIGIISRNVVGTGIRVRLADSSNKGGAATVALFNEWARKKKNCDYDNLKNFYGLQKLVMRGVAEGGEMLVRKRIVNDKKFPLKLQVLEPDFLDSGKEVDSLDDGGYIIQGVQYNKDGLRTGYWLFNRHPGDYFGMKGLVSEFVSADEVLHIYDVERAGQTRGTPEGASSMMRLRDFDDYEDAQLMRQKIAACFAVFVQDNADTIATGSGTSKGDLSERVEPGIIQTLPSGKTVTFASPPGAEGYADYSRGNLRGVAAGYDVTYEALTGDYSNVNFSSGRMGWLEFQRSVTDWQDDIMVSMFCDPVWDWFVLLAKISNGAKEAATDWTRPRREMIDPVKEVQAVIDAIDAGLVSWQEAVRERGYDPDELLEQIKQDREKFKKAGVEFNTSSKAKTTDPAPDPETEPGAK